ncbi:sensor histidine kinase [Paenibacillus cellulosilyticus]|uniref:sensor histidine kinase n=1 Tax=Paenibacillus cellulosilyticus TaxID=375489 RepID=UPI001FE36E59|nr:HAMP domain-containing sensor histidine kinase [Paenibacillus cellulosilyticus]
MNEWIRQWLLKVVICLLLVFACTTYFFWNRVNIEQGTESKAVINQVRLYVNEMLLFLDNHYAEIMNDVELQASLRAMAEASDTGVVYTDLTGQIVFNSYSNAVGARINPGTDLHYDLYQARLSDQRYRIAFPVVDEVTQAQVGNAIFTIPASLVFAGRTKLQVLAPYLTIALLLVILALLVIQIHRKMSRDMVKPIHQLKDFSEAILKGDLEQKFTYQNMDEIGEVYAMFDQMRLEIMHHSHRRDEQEQAQKELISNISHELKTPLTTLKAYIEAIREGSCSNMQEVMEYVEVMHNSTEKMSRLTEDLLLHALKELGQISVTLTEQYSREVFDKILRPIGHYIRTTGVHYIEPEGIPNVLIHVDAQRMEQVIANLISNALKHTSAGDTIRVNIELEQGQLKITIADTGNGILPQDMPFVFDRYFKGKSNEGARSKGTGLGLSICKYIIEAHEGTIYFKSRQGSGTVFYCLIPMG